MPSLADRSLLGNLRDVEEELVGLVVDEVRIGRTVRPVPIALVQVRPR
jgi:hypothetical protein